MRYWFVVLNQSQESWHAAYTAYHLAARGGDRLIGAASLDHQLLVDAERVLVDFEVGARSANVAVDTMLIPDLSPATLASFPFEISAMLCGCFLDKEIRAGLDELIRKPPFPIWFVPEQRSLRRIMIAAGPEQIGANGLQDGLLLAKRLNLELHLMLPKGYSLPPSFLAEATNVPMLVDSVHTLSMQAAKALAGRRQIDLLLVDQSIIQPPLSGIFAELSCILGIYPSLSSF